jgi:hypothetical protein
MSGRRWADGVAALAIVGILVFVITGPLSDNPPPTHEQYVQKADKVCSNVEAEQAKLDNTIFKDIPFDRSPPDYLYVKYVKALIPTYRQQLKDLRKITPPTGDAPKLQRYFAATEGVIALLEEIAADPKKVPLLTKTNVFEAADAEARAYGLLACGHAED